MRFFHPLFSAQYNTISPWFELGGVSSNITTTRATVGVNGTWGTCQMSIFGDGDGGHDRCSMGPKQVLERAFLA